MDGFDSLLVGVGIIGLLLTAVAVYGKRNLAETGPIGVGSLGVALVGLGGMIDMLWLLILGALMLAGAVYADWLIRKRSSDTPGKS
ncbi:MAG TPA: hypothetical protein VH186_16840 [Chloroflexia bacterium]|nr:hypothetical protein [Chloroflexia bacterium]